MATERLYYTNSYLVRFDARLEAIRDHGEGTALGLDRSAFYPASGGQPNDTGTLSVDGQSVAVTDVMAEDGVVWHVLERRLEGIAPGIPVQGVVDWPRRFDNMQQHSGQHLLSQVFDRLYDAETVSVHMGAEESTLDLAVATLAPGQVDAAEQEANYKVFAALPITATFVDEADIPALRLRRPPKVSGTIRIVEIEDFDFSACGGTHCRSTAEIGPIKIVRTERRKGIVRLTFLCGRRAVEDYRRKHRILSDAAALFSSDMAQVPVLAERNLAQVKELQHRVEEQQGRLLALDAQELLQGAEAVGSLRLVCALRADLDAAALRTLASTLVAEPGVVALLASVQGGKTMLAFARSADGSAHMGNLLRSTLQQVGGNGGGRQDFAQAGGVDGSLASTLLDAARATLAG